MIYLVASAVFNCVLFVFGMVMCIKNGSLKDRLDRYQKNQNDMNSRDESSHKAKETIRKLAAQIADECQD